MKTTVPLLAALLAALCLAGCFTPLDKEGMVYVPPAETEQPSKPAPMSRNSPISASLFLMYAIASLTVTGAFDASAGGVVTFKNARHSLEVASELPLDRLLLETDAPYMAPVPFRGKRCDSSMIVYAAEKIGALRNIGVQELLDITCENARRFYGIE